MIGFREEEHNYKKKFPYATVDSPGVVTINFCNVGFSLSVLVVGAMLGAPAGHDLVVW